MRYFWIRPLFWREFLLPYVSLSHLPLHLLTQHSSPLAPAYTCYRDSANTPRCSLHTSYTITRTTTTSTPTSTFSSPRPTSTPDSNGDGNNDDPPDFPDSNNSNSNSNNSTRSSSSSTLRSSPSGTAAGATSGANDWKGSSTFFGLAPLLVLISVCMW